MDLSQIPLFAAARKRLSWLDRRQEVLAQNIAHADTPGFRPRDLKGLAFQAMIQRESGRLDLRASQVGHLAGPKRADAGFADKPTRRPFETSPSGNAVVLEEQMAKVNETSLAHNMTSGLYRKHLTMIRLALGDRR